MTKSALETTRQTHAAYGMLDGSGTVLAAVSGGADSMALLHLLHRTGIPLGVAHFDHQTRQGESALDAHFVAAVAEALGLPFFPGSSPVAELAGERGESFEMAARRERYAFLVATAKEHGYGSVATGHHADDQAETVLLRLLRGASPRGLAGIPPIRVAEGIRIIRPLLHCTRADLRDWLSTEDIAWREDASNAGEDHLRNRIRHGLLPALARDFNPGIGEALNRLARLQRMDDTLLDGLADDALGPCRDTEQRLLRAAFRALDPALQHRCMVKCIHAAGGNADFDGVTEAVAFILHGSAGKQMDLGNGVALYLGADHGVFAPLAPAMDDRTLALPISGAALGFGRVFQVRLLDGLPAEPLRTYCHAGRQVFDADALPGGLTIRRRRPGDRFRPLGMAGTKKLKEVFNDLGLTRPERDEQLLVESGGRIVWIPGHTISRDAAVNADTTRLLELSIEAPVAPGGAERLQQAHSLSVGGPTTRSTVSLCLYRDVIDIDAITAALHVSPTKSQRRGQVIGKRRPAPIGLWSLQPSESLGFEEKLKYLVDTTPADQQTWDDLAREHHIVLRCAVFLSSWTEGFDLPADLLSAMGRRHWELSLSMYSASGEEVLDAFLRGPGSGGKRPSNESD